jgi:hypothetical protein
MTIHGGGKLPPNAGRPSSADRPRRAAEKRQAREAGVTQAPPRAVRRDTFETAAASSAPMLHQASNPAGGSLLSQSFKLDEIMQSPSQVKQMAEAITAHARKLGGEFDTLRGMAQDVVSGLARKGFSPDDVNAARPQLGQLRKDMSQLRGKIAAGHRRLKMLKLAASRMGDTKLTEKVGTQLRRIGDMERGWGRTFLALGIAGTMSTPHEGDGAIGHRVALGQASSVDRHALGTYMANAAPGTAASQLLVQLLEEGPQAPTGRLVAEAYAELHADVLAGRLGKSLQGLGLWRQAMG